MAWVTGTANGHIDLMEKLMAFLSTNEELVAAGQNWEILRNEAFPFTFPWPGRLAFSNQPGSWTIVAPDTWPINAASNNVKMRFTGKIVIPETGNYAFSIRVQDQMEVRIDGVVVAAVYAANVTNSFIEIGSANLTAGQHDIQVDYVKLAGTTSMVGLGWRKPGDVVFSIIPAANFSNMVARYGHATYANPSANDMATTMLDREYAIKGPGLSGADEIYLNLKTYGSAQLDLYNIEVRYSTGFDPTRNWMSQPGTSSAEFALLWNQDIKYWFIANGRRFMVIAKVSTTYASLHGGFILPYGLPSEMPYPIAVGGGSPSNVRWSHQDERHSSFWNPGAYGSSTVAGLYLRRTDGSQEVFANVVYSTSPNGWTYPYRDLIAYRTSPSNDYALQPVTLYSSTGGGNVWGELQGVYHISGFNNASENTLVIDGKTYLVVQSGYRSGPNDYAAILLE